MHIAAGGDELVETLAHRLKHLGEAFGRRPAVAAILADAFGFVESRRIEPGKLRQPGGRKAVPFGQGIDGIPDGAVRQHTYKTRALEESCPKAGRKS
jgi:hypothetical protein